MIFYINIHNLNGYLGKCTPNGKLCLFWEVGDVIAKSGRNYDSAEQVCRRGKFPIMANFEQFCDIPTAITFLLGMLMLLIPSNSLQNVLL